MSSPNAGDTIGECTCGYKTLLHSYLTCSVCRGPLKDTVSTRCGHMFCAECLQKWITTSTSYSCPECRKMVLPYQIRPLYNIRALFSDLDSDYKFRKDKPKISSTREVAAAGSTNNLLPNNSQPIFSSEMTVRRWILTENNIWRPQTESRAHSNETSPSAQGAAGGEPAPETTGARADLSSDSLVEATESNSSTIGRYMPTNMIRNGFSRVISCARNKLGFLEQEIRRARRLVERNRTENRQLSDSLDTLRESILSRRERSSQLLQESRAINELIGSANGGRDQEDVISSNIVQSEVTNNSTAASESTSNIAQHDFLSSHSTSHLNSFESGGRVRRLHMDTPEELNTMSSLSVLMRFHPTTIPTHLMNRNADDVFRQINEYRIRAECYTELVGQLVSLLRVARHCLWFSQNQRDRMKRWVRIYE